MKIMIFIIILVRVQQNVINNNKDITEPEPENFMVVDKNFTNTDFYLNKQLFIKCGEKYCRHDHGECISNIKSLCQCKEEFTTYPKSTKYECNYTRKKQLIAFCLELVLVCGIGHYYLGKILTGIWKFILCIIGVIIILVLRFYNRDKEEDNPVSLAIALGGCIVFSVIIGWQAFDIIMLILNKYNDSNDIELYPFRADFN